MKAVQYLLAHQLPNGAFAIPEFGLENYNTAVAVMALHTIGNSGNAGALAKAKAYLLSVHNTEQTGVKEEENKQLYGSFGYGDARRGDLSNTAFSLEALKELGLEKDSPAWKNAVKFIKRCQDNKETNDLPDLIGGWDSGGFVYAPGDFPTGAAKAHGRPKPYGNMTYEAVKSLLYAGLNKDDPALQAAFKWIKNNYSVKEHPGANGTEGYFYYVHAMAKALTVAEIKELELADGRKANWARDLAAHLASIQKADGSFVNEDGRWMEANSIISTAYALEALNLCVAALE